MVAAALVESCCDSIDEARAAKLLSRALLFPLLIPSVHSPERLMTGSNFGLIRVMTRAAF